MRPLELTTFPLSGVRLIEASAGTGKTYTITGLYLRLLLERNLSVTEVLVVTFTEAATQELRGRIRQRLVQAIDYLEGKRPTDDLADLLDTYQLQSDGSAVQQLRDAVTRMDEAAVFTIHGFCQRTLADSAFESGNLFDLELISDEADLRNEAIRDFWRTHVIDARGDHLHWILPHWQSPERLLSSVAPLLAYRDVEIQPAVDATLGAEAERWMLETGQRVRAAWLDVADELFDLLMGAALLTRNEKSYREDRLRKLFDQMAVWVETQAPVSALPEHFELLTDSCLNDPNMHKKPAAKRGAPVPEHDFFTLADQLAKQAAAFEQQFKVSFMIAAADYVRTELARRKAESRVLYYDDLLSNVDSALRSSRGESLARHIRTRYPVAMVDEFQDTDPQQYGIFRRVYRGAEDCGLFMIGDPKQAIYSFRGADVFTYMQARHDTDADDDQFTLTTNYRSHSGLVDAVNALFSRVSAPFVYDDDIVFHPVAAAGLADQSPFRIGDRLARPLVCWHVPITDGNTGRKRGEIPKTKAYPALAGGCAVEIARLLNLGLQGEARIGDRNLSAADIAILVRDRHEAAQVRRALHQQGIASVFLSRDSVFEADEAAELSHLLSAVAAPSDAVLLRTAMATRLMGFTASDIHHLADDRDRWDRLVMDFQRYHRLWQEQGFMPMAQRLLREQGVIARLLAADGGERRMTDLLQLADLLQSASSKQTRIDSLLRWFTEQRLAPNGNAEDQQLRMESDEHLVQVVTIHKSKGLEYPIVFLPFIWGGKATRPDDIVIWHRDTDRQLMADLGSADRTLALEQAARERLAEDVRLLYVAFTRARHRCYFAWGRFSDAHTSALAWVLGLHGTPLPDDDTLRQVLAEIGGSNGAAVSVRDLPSGMEYFSGTDARDAAMQARVFKGDARRRWRIGSFSALTATAHPAAQIPDLPDHDQDTAPDSAAVQPEVWSRYNFPRGPQAGLLLHQILECIDFPAAAGGSLNDTVFNALAQYGLAPEWAPVVTDWVGDILDTALSHDSCALRSVASTRRLVELGFDFPVGQLTAAGLNRVISRYRDQPEDSDLLVFPPWAGLMKGFIDLVFEHDGKFYVVDYKSNHLGDCADDYRTDSLLRSMYEHHYDLQYLIYTVAIHRYLRSRLPDYDYQRHIGGVFYLFLRGMQPSTGPTSGVWHTRPPFAVIDELDQLFDAGVQAGASYA